MKRNGLSEEKKKKAKARRKMAKAWNRIEQGPGYQYMVLKEYCRYESGELKEELFDGINLRFDDRNSRKSHSVQKRILRRIVEKRQAQAIHRAMGHAANRLCTSLLNEYSSSCMQEINKHTFHLNG